MKAAPNSTTDVGPLKLHSLARRLAAWRAKRTRGHRIPERLWKQAAQLARAHGLSATSSVLKLNYYDLQRRLGPAQASRATQQTPPQFVQLSAVGSGCPATEPGTVELLRPCGGRLILRLPNASARQILPLVQAILRS